MYLKPDNAISDLRYEVTSEVPVISGGREAQGAAGRPRPVRAVLDLPADFPQNVTDLAEQVTSGKDRRGRRPTRSRRYLNTDGGFVYNDQVARSHSINTLEEFLFERREGYCEQFASAFAAMARSHRPADARRGRLLVRHPAGRRVAREEQGRARLAGGVLLRPRLGAARADARPRRQRTRRHG